MQFTDFLCYRGPSMGSYNDVPDGEEGEHMSVRDPYLPLHPLCRTMGIIRLCVLEIGQRCAGTA